MPVHSVLQWAGKTLALFCLCNNVGLLLPHCIVRNTCLAAVHGLTNNMAFDMLRVSGGKRHRHFVL